MTPAETAAWDAEIDAREGRVRVFLPCQILPVFATSHRRPYSRLRERDIFDEAHTPRHAKRSHRAEVAG